MINLDTVIFIHQKVLKEFGGRSGIRDINLLKSAIARPIQTFDGKDLYPTNVEKAVALFESIISNHPFIDGNKRVAYTVLRLLLLETGLDIDASEQEKYDFVIACAKNEVDFESKILWIKERIKNVT